MPELLVDLSSQVRQGLPFALRPVSGGTGRDDGYAMGLAIDCICRDAAIVAGDFVALEGAGLAWSNLASTPRVVRIASTQDRVFGVAVGTPPGAQNEPVEVLVYGLYSYAKVAAGNPEDFLAPTATAGTVTGTATIQERACGRLVVSPVSGRAPVIVDSGMVFSSAHRNLAGVSGLIHHTNLIEALTLSATTSNAAFTVNNPANINDSDDTTYHSSDIHSTTPAIVSATLALARASGGARFLIGASNSAGSVTAEVDGSPDGTTWTTLGSSTFTIDSSLSAVDQTIYWNPSTAYLYYRLKISSGSSLTANIYDWKLFEAAGAVLVVDDPRAGQTSNTLDAVLAAISAGSSIPAGTYELATQGGQDVIKGHGSLGAAATFNPADGNVHTGTLTANCTVTLTAPTGSGACTLELWLTEDATGGWTVTWPGSVTEQGTHSTALNTTSRVILESLDGGATWVASWVGSGATSVGLTMPAEFAVAGSPVTSSGTLAVSKANQAANLVYAGPSSGAATAPTFRALVAADIPTGVAGANDHEHVIDCLFSGDGATVAWTLPASPFDQNGVAAYVAGVLTEVTLSGADWAVATFGAAPAAGTNNVRFDIVAAVA